MPHDLRSAPPRPAREELGGLVLFARTLDKARAKRAGTLGAYKIGPGLSAYQLEWLGLDEAALLDAVAERPDDESMVAWLHAHTDRTTYASINARLRIRGIRDAAHRTAMQDAYPVLRERPDASNWFDVLDYDDAAQFGGTPALPSRRYVTFAGEDGVPRGGIVAGPAVRAFPDHVGTLERFVALTPAERDEALIAAGMPVPFEDIRLLAPLRPKNPSSAVSARADRGAELALVIGTRCRDLTPENALEAAFGYTCLSDATARDLQRPHERWFGPWVVDARDVPDPQDPASTAATILPVRDLLAELSRGTTLEPGDVVRLRRLAPANA